MTLIVSLICFIFSSFTNNSHDSITKNQKVDYEKHK